MSAVPPMRGSLVSDIGKKNRNRTKTPTGRRSIYVIHFKLPHDEQLALIFRLFASGWKIAGKFGALKENFRLPSRSKFKRQTWCKSMVVLTYPQGFGLGPGSGAPATAQRDTRDTSPNTQCVSQNIPENAILIRSHWCQLTLLPLSLLDLTAELWPEINTAWLTVMTTPIMQVTVLKVGFHQIGFKEI